MTRLELENAVGRRLNKNTSSWNADTQTRLRHFLNQRHRRLLAMPGMQHLRDGVLTFASIAADADYVGSNAWYGLPNVASVQRMWETTNDRVLSPMDLATYRAIAPDPSTSAGTPEAYVFKGYDCVAMQPITDPAALKVKSTTADTGTVYIEGDLTGGYPSSVSTTLNGTAYVTVTGSWARVRKFYLATAAAGQVTLAQDMGALAALELGRLGVGQLQQKYWTFYLHPQPSVATTYSVDYTKALTDLAQATDEPLIPEDFHALLELGATMDELVKTDDQRYVIAAREYADLIKDLKYWIARQAAGRQQSPEFSRLGANFPAWH